MTIKKGSAYGEPDAELGPNGVLCADDAAASAAVAAARRENRPVPTLGLQSGDLARTLGGSGSLDVAYPVDLGQVLVDGRLHLFVAHCVVRTRFWGKVIAVGNAQWLDGWNVWPKGHPNDGRLDVLEADLPVGQRWQANKLLPTGAHIPHPGIKTTKTSSLTFELPRPMPVRCDGVVVARGRTLAFRADPDALRVVA